MTDTPENDAGGIGPTDITPISITDEMRKSYLDYAMSVIVSRALPDVRDGLASRAPAHPLSMHEQGYEHNKPYRKSARVVGDVIGKYHPHGDPAVYMAMVRMAQEFSMRVTLIDGQGNFGSVDGDMPAAMRYTEVRMERSRTRCPMTSTRIRSTSATTTTIPSSNPRCCLPGSPTFWSMAAAGSPWAWRPIFPATIWAR